MPVGTFASAVHIAAVACTDALIEPFDSLSAWTNSGASLVTGRTGTGVSVNSTAAVYTLPSASEYITVGFAYKTSHVNPQHDIMRFLLAGAIENRLVLTTTGGLWFIHGSGQGLVTSANVITATNTWYYVEIQYRSHDSLGTVLARVDGTEVLNSTGLDTRDIAIPDQIQLIEAVGSTGTYDDLYLSTGAGCSFKGDPFPLVATTSTETGVDTLTTTPNPIPAPSGVVAGDVLIAFVTSDGGPVISASTGWTELANSTVNTSIAIKSFGRIADGGANDTLSVTTNSGSLDYCCAIHRITGHGAITIADVKAAGGSTNAASSTPDPPNLDTGSTKNWLFLVSAGLDRIVSNSLTAVPTNYTIIGAMLASATNTTSCVMSTAQRNLRTQTENPGTFTASTATSPWGAITVAVPGRTTWA